MHHILSHHCARIMQFLITDIILHICKFLDVADILQLPRVCGGFHARLQEYLVINDKRSMLEHGGVLFEHIVKTMPKINRIIRDQFYCNRGEGFYIQNIKTGILRIDCHSPATGHTYFKIGYVQNYMMSLLARVSSSYLTGHTSKKTHVAIPMTISRI